MDNIDFLQDIHRTNSSYLLFCIIMYYCLIYQKEFSVSRDKIHYLLFLLYSNYTVHSTVEKMGIGRKVFLKKAKISTEFGV